MTTTKKLLPITAALLAAFALGAYAVRLWPEGEHAEQRRLGESLRAAAPLKRQYREGDHASAKEAALALVRHYDKCDAESKDPLNPYAHDAMMYVARLAELERKQNGGGDAEMREAVRRCERLNGIRGRRHDCSAERLRALVAQTDAMPPTIYEQ
jgi:hypothetical protein